MNGMTETRAKKVFFDTLIGRNITTKGLVTDHDEEITKAGAQQIWDALKLADIEVSMRE